MVHIAMCEDETLQTQYFTKLISQWSTKTGNKIVLDSYANAEQFLFSIDSTYSYDLLILDIQMGKMNGMELAKKIRKTNKEILILFVTGLKDYAVDGYEVGAIRYLIKPVKEEEFYQIMDKIQEELATRKVDFYVFTSESITNRVAYSDILYLEADGHYVSLVTQEREYRWKANFSSLSEVLEQKGFFLLRRGLYVNLEQVKSIERDTCTLENDEKLPVSKSRYRQLNDAFISFYRNKRFSDY